MADQYGIHEPVFLAGLVESPFKLPAVQQTPQLHSQMCSGLRGRFASIPILLGLMEVASVFVVQRSHFIL